MTVLLCSVLELFAIQVYIQENWINKENVELTFHWVHKHLAERVGQPLSGCQCLCVMNGLLQMHPTSVKCCRLDLSFKSVIRCTGQVFCGDEKLWTALVCTNGTQQMFQNGDMVLSGCGHIAVSYTHLTLPTNREV